MSQMNPFNYQGPVSPDHLIDRQEELFALQKAAANRVNIRIAAPRRYGKTSLIEAHLRDMRRAGHHALRVDFYRAATISDIAKRLLSVYERELPGSRGAMLKIGRSLGLKVGTGGISASMTQHWEHPRAIPVDEARALLIDLLDLPAQSHSRDGRLTVICFDEFQDLLIADPGIDGLFRSVIQSHEQAAAYIYAGSSPSLMRQLFSLTERPFYGQARPLDLPPLPFAETFDELKRRFLDHDLPVSEDDLEAIITLGRGHPQRTMLLAHHLFDCLDEGKASPAQAATDRALAEIDSACSATWESFNRAEKSVVVSIADGLAPTGSTTAREHAITRSSLQRALKDLTQSETHLIKPGPKIQLLDPLFEEWLRRR